MQKLLRIKEKINNIRMMGLPVPWMIWGGALLILVLYAVVNVNDRAALHKFLERDEAEILLSLEAPLYVQYLERRFNIEGFGRRADIEHFSSLHESNDKLALLRILFADRGFPDYLRNEGELLFEPHQMRQWLDLQQRLVAPLRARFSTHSLGIIPEQFRWSSSLTHLLTDHHPLRLMLYVSLLALVGIFVEAFLRRKRFIVLTVTALTVGAWTYSLFASSSSPIVLGGSWLLMLLLGLAVAIWYQNISALGKRGVWRIAAALSLIGALFFIDGWFAWQDGTSMLTATLIFCMGLLARPWVCREPELQVESGESEKQAWAERAGLAEAMQSISSMDFGLARKQLLNLMHRFPDSRIILEQLYCLEKLQPEGETFWACARKRVEFATRQNDYEMMLGLFEDVQKGALTKQRARARLKPEHYHQMMAIFIKHGDLNKAEQAYLFLELAGERPIIMEACRLLHDEYARRQNVAKSHEYSLLLERLENPE